MLMYHSLFFCGSVFDAGQLVLIEMHCGGVFLSHRGNPKMYNLYYQCNFSSMKH